MNIIHLISNKSWGGGEKYALDLCKALEERGHSTAVITRNGYPAVDRPFADAGIAVGHLPLRGALDILSPLVLSRILDRLEGPVVVHVHNFKDALVALRARRLMKSDRRRGLRVVCTRHLVRPAKTGPLDRGTYRDLDALIFVSDAARAAFMATAPADLNSDPRICVIHNAIPLPKNNSDQKSRESIANVVGTRHGASAASEKSEKIADEVGTRHVASAPTVSANASELSASSEKFRFLFAGRIAPEKGLDVLVEAFRRVELARPGAAVLTVCGTGDSRTVMPIVRTTRAPELDGKVTWAGHVDDVSAEIAHADAGVVPSRAPEAFGLAALEFMAAGIPVIASEIGALPEVIGPDGILVPPDDPAALADAMLRLIDSPELCARLGEAGKRRAAENFAYDKFVDSVIAVYEGK